MSAITEPRRSRRFSAVRLARAALFACGVAVAAWCVTSVGATRVALVLRAAGVWLPAIVALELGIWATDYLALRRLLGDAARTAAPSTWLRAMSLAYALGVLLPAGRAGGEAARAATLAGDVDPGAATRASARLQVCALYGNAIASVAIAVLATSGTLSWALAGNAAICGGLGGALHALVESGRFSRGVAALLLRFGLARVDGAKSAARAPRGALGAAVLFALTGRAAQALQYGVVVAAVGARATPMRALAAQGIHLVGATAGDFVPNQIGITEGAYRLLASSVDLGDAPAKALSIALVVRIAQLGLAVTLLVVAAAAARRTASAAGRR